MSISVGKGGDVKISAAIAQTYIAGPGEMSISFLLDESRERPDAREFHTAVWTGSEMIGGRPKSRL